MTTPIERQADPVREHIDRCIEAYCIGGSEDYAVHPTRDSYELMRADLLLAVGMLMVLATKGPGQ